MTRENTRYVVDASVGVKLFLVEPLSDRAHTLFSSLAVDPPTQLYVPDLFFAECANVLWKYVRRFGYSSAEAQQAISDLLSLDLSTMATQDLVRSAFAIATTNGISVYDACYVALANRLDAMLVTADERLVQILKSSQYDVCWLGDLNLPPSAQP